jgi:hypothetical protein
MTGERIPPEALREFRRARNLGALIDVVTPLAVSIVVILFCNIDALAGSSTPAAGLAWLKYGLAAFSVTTCIVARIILGRLVGEVRRLARHGVYRRGRVTYSYLILFALYLAPTVWGLGYYALAGDVAAFLFMTAISVLAYLFLTPDLENLWLSGRR